MEWRQVWQTHRAAGLFGRAIEINRDLHRAGSLICFARPRLPHTVMDATWLGQSVIAAENASANTLVGLNDVR
ncbi:hypothetical protein GCM10011505_29580 [Tistrella bauzanensis]|uniref:Uncharacterized protein n=1 Tax=Tistrella bauzanensis TaxID=657419 RepID=A0ABQ1IPG2_9PROT|nr:hypothetical protein GCM10011505_29580 [Tistrella bauzanensis]